MDMQVNTQLIRTEREQRAWNQSHLADVSGLVLLLNGPAVNPEFGVSQGRCLYAGESCSVGSRKQAMRVINDGSRVHMVENRDGPVLSCIRQNGNMRWVVLQPPA